MATKAYVIYLLQNGNIRPSRSPYAAPLFFVEEKNKLRGVLNFRALNIIRKKYSTPLSRRAEMLDIIGRTRAFTKMDLEMGFH